MPFAQQRANTNIHNTVPPAQQIVYKHTPQSHLHSRSQHISTETLAWQMVDTTNKTYICIANSRNKNTTTVQQVLNTNITMTLAQQMVTTNAHCHLCIKTVNTNNDPCTVTSGYKHIAAITQLTEMLILVQQTKWTWRYENEPCSLTKLIIFVMMRKRMMIMTLVTDNNGTEIIMFLSSQEYSKAE